MLFEGIGVLLEQKLIDIDLVDDLFGPTLNLLWDRMQPVIVAMRKGLNQPYFFSHYEYLVNNLKVYRGKKVSKPMEGYGKKVQITTLKYNQN